MTVHTSPCGVPAPSFLRGPGQAPPSWGQTSTKSRTPRSLSMNPWAPERCLLLLHLLQRRDPGGWRPYHWQSPWGCGELAGATGRCGASPRTGRSQEMRRLRGSSPGLAPSSSPEQAPGPGHPAAARVAASPLLLCPACPAQPQAPGEACLPRKCGECVCVHRRVL